MTNIKLHLQNHSPLLISTQGNRQASVAMVLRNLDSVPQMFFIERAQNENDPWSGQIAFPAVITTMRTAIPWLPRSEKPMKR